MSTFLKKIVGDGTSNHRAALEGDAVIFNGVDQYFELGNFNISNLQSNSIYTMLFAAQTPNAISGPVFSTATNNAQSPGAQYFVSSSQLFRSSGQSSYKLHQLWTQFANNVFISARKYGAGIPEFFDLGNGNLPTSSFLTGAFVPYTHTRARVGWNDLGYNNNPTGQHFQGKIKRIEVVNFAASEAQIRRSYNEGSFAGFVPNNQFILQLNGDDYNTTTGEWRDQSPNGYVFSAYNNPTKGSFL